MKEAEARRHTHSAHLRTRWGPVRGAADVGAIHAGPVEAEAGFRIEALAGVAEGGTGGGVGLAERPVAVFFTDGAGGAADRDDRAPRIRVQVGLHAAGRDGGDRGEAGPRRRGSRACRCCCRCRPASTSVTAGVAVFGAWVICANRPIAS